MLTPSVIRSSVVAEAPRPIERICEIIEEYKKENKIENVEAISIGVPSSVENDKETVICTTNICDENGKAVFTHTNLAKDIREHFQIPVYINNDVNNILMYDIVSNHLENQKVIVGGGVPEMADFPKEEFENEVNRNTGKDVMSYGFDYLYSQEFVGKGVIGAAVFARMRLYRKK